METEFEKEKQILLRNLNIEREKYRLLTARIIDAVKDSDSIAQTQLFASSGQSKNVEHKEREEVSPIL